MQSSYKSEHGGLLPCQVMMRCSTVLRMMKQALLCLPPATADQVPLKSSLRLGEPVWSIGAGRVK